MEFWLVGALALVAGSRLLAQSGTQPDWKALEPEDDDAQLYRFVRYNYEVVLDLARAQ
jgi:hypothetical protein